MVADGEAAPAGAVVVGEIAVGIEAIGEFVGELAQLVGAMLAAQPSQLGFGLLAGFDVNGVGQPVTKAPDHRQVTGADFPVALRLCGGRQPGRQRLTGDRLAFAQIGGLTNTARRFSAGDSQPVRQCTGQLAAQLGRIGLLGDLIDQWVLDGRQLAAHRLAALQHGQPLRGGQHIERQPQGTVQVSLQRVEDLDNLPGLFASMFESYVGPLTRIGTKKPLKPK